ncbi:4-hydroxythreonine-4-phosphate dehydrogenase PdxA [Sphingorhabdus lutea]|uniref:4-hydroxythreonine-4-phosphate dehydrogenase n=1 Tax=Sphingorhabdus lutea TaxID=1913578 RepID=A0A1L3JCH9_9SPHN|nr:4-hydroxythreonine-4-phosphate dehydrogenase PdxA [Sphingorhabdus lutea]APG62857.1 4-hydroxythreonine-4-phosphate dehydrogenase PdxA [Sphingorhabdus lutea]
MSGNKITTPIAISIGDPAGVGPEIIAKGWEGRKAENLPPFFAIGDQKSIEHYWDGPTAIIEQPSEALAVFDHALPILNMYDGGDIAAGMPTLAGANCAFQALEMATGFAKSGAACALVTGPVSKIQLYSVGFTHPGQTEFIAERCGVSQNNAIMMLAGPSLRVVPLTTHIALNAVSAALTSRVIRQKIRATAKGLQRNFGIEKPRIAVAGLNPHAGENGKFGHEEDEIMRPALAALRAEGYDISGPLSADTMFHRDAREKYDVAICGYHDQALVPLKTLYFYEAVNITLGLPMVRTSPDHGPAFEIAGKNIASEKSMIEAIKMAYNAAQARANYLQQAA